MPDHTARQSIVHLGRAMDRGDLETAAAACRRLQDGLGALPESELLAIREQLSAYREKACALRDTCGAQLRNTIRGRQNIDAYRDGSSLA